MKTRIKLVIVVALFYGCKEPVAEIQTDKQKKFERHSLSMDNAQMLIELPWNCIGQEFPNKLNQVIDSEEDLKPPAELHPAFYGCFDWHSAVHGQWSLVRLARSFPELNANDSILKRLRHQINSRTIQGEIAYFRDETNQGFERMYGWAWLLKLATEIHHWDHPQAKELEEDIQPLSQLIANKTMDFLPKLNYPIRVGTHTNTAFALTMAYDYAIAFNDTSLLRSITECSKRFYLLDRDCPLSWEPGGYDFLSPCLEEADLMRRILNAEEFKAWLIKFLPQLTESDFKLEPGKVSDRKDGHLVHLDGLNFSRAWCLYGIAEKLPEYNHLVKIANTHIEYSLQNLTGDSYEGGHWLASFALLSLTLE